MEVKAGYKQTEVGVIPEDWEETKLGKIADITKLAGFEYSNYFNSYKDGGDIIVIRGTNITNNRLDLSDIKAIPRATSNFLQRSKLQKGDLVFAYVGTIGPIYLIKENDKYHLGPNTARITVKSNIDPQYVFWYFCSNLAKKEIIEHTSVGAQPSLSMFKIRNFRISIPKRSEQKAIAEALSDADALIEALEQLLAKKHQVKQGAMQELLTGKKRLPGFSGEWEEKKLGDIAEITKLAGFEYSKYFNSYKDGGDIIVIRGTNITHNKLDLSDVKTIPQSTSNFLQRSKLQKGDLVFAYVGTIGPVYLITENNKYHLGPNTARITVKDNVSSQFVFWYFCSSFAKREIDEHISVGAQPSLSMTKIRKFKISLPEYSEQTAIAEILSDIDAEITALEAKLSKAREVKAGMMSELLTGKIRLNRD